MREDDSLGLREALKGRNDSALDALIKIQYTVVCSICQDIMHAPCVTSCGHGFCYECLSEWLKSHAKTCPTCRHKLTQRPSLSHGLKEISSVLVDALISADPSKSEEYETARKKAITEYEEDIKYHGVPFPFSFEATTLADVEDGVMRCPRCHWEVEPGMTVCDNCGNTVQDGDERYLEQFRRDEEGEGSDIMLEGALSGSDLSDYMRDGFVVDDDDEEDEEEDSENEYSNDSYEEDEDHSASQGPTVVSESQDEHYEDELQGMLEQARQQRDHQRLTDIMRHIFVHERALSESRIASRNVNINYDQFDTRAEQKFLKVCEKEHHALARGQLLHINAVHQVREMFENLEESSLRRRGRRRPQVQVSSESDDEYNQTMDHNFDGISTIDIDADEMDLSGDDNGSQEEDEEPQHRPRRRRNEVIVLSDSD
uniref:ARAD1C42724p n=1 Tax=Blastobotrys adeninivorans TaxID=409370 RepID=A0A060T9A7_BLAAD